MSKTKETKLSMSRPKSQLQNVHDQMDTQINKMKNNKERLKQLDEQIADCRAKLIDLRRQSRPPNESESRSAVNKTILILDRRINNGVDKANNLIAKNNAKRQNIDKLRQERVVYDGIYKKLEKELYEKMGEMKSLAEDGRRAMISRDRAKVECEQLEQELDDKRGIYESNYREYIHLKDNEEMLKQTRQYREKNSNANVNVCQAVYNQQSSGDKSAMCGKTINVEMGCENDDRGDDTFNINIANQILDATGCSSIDEIIRELEDGDDKNFSLYQYCSTCTLELEELENNLRTIKKETESTKARQRASPQKRKVSLMQEQKRAMAEESSKYEKKIKQANRTLNQLKSGILSMITTMKCNIPVEHQLDGETLSDSNTLTYIAFIESVRMFAQLINFHSRDTMSIKSILFNRFG